MTLEIAVCWNCHGRPYRVAGDTLSHFPVGAVAIETWSGGAHGRQGLGEWLVIKHAPNGTTVVESVITGERKTENSSANSWWIRADERDTYVEALRRVTKANRRAGKIPEMPQ